MRVTAADGIVRLPHGRWRVIALDEERWWKARSQLARFGYASVERSPRMQDVEVHPADYEDMQRRGYIVEPAPELWRR